MALNKDIELLNGITTQYHRIMTVRYDVLNDMISVMIQSYIDKSYRDEEKNYIQLQNEANKLLDTIQSQNLSQEEKEIYNEKIKKISDKLEDKIQPIYCIDVNEVNLSIKPCAESRNSSAGNYNIIKLFRHKKHFLYIFS